jgi:hypothetical protein
VTAELTENGKNRPGRVQQGARLKSWSSEIKYQYQVMESCCVHTCIIGTDCSEVQGGGRTIIAMKQVVIFS